MSSFYLTTPIYYASGEPHLGHAYTTILADVIARYRRRAGQDVLFLTGTDEHGQKIQEAAAEQGMSPLELCDLMAGRFEEAWEDLGISHDRFIRTTETEHRAVVMALLERLKDNGHIYEAEYAGWYSVGQERYFTEKEIGPDRVDPIAGGPVQRIREKNYFFRMSHFQERLVRHIEENPEWIVPATRRNEVLGFLAQPLADLSISRPRARIHWGIPLPWDEAQVCYVWVDALTNYVTASGAIDPGAPKEERGFVELRPSRWPADVHLMGKDILTTHAVYWPTLLMGADLPLPRRILAHGWWVVGDTKMSKSLGNVVDPLDLRERFGTGAVRWYLMREMATGQDASYTPDRFLTRYDELSNILGNLAHRTLSMVKRYRGGIVPDAPSDGLAAETGKALAAYRDGLEGYRLHEGFAAAMNLARGANGFVEAKEPWALARDPEGGNELDRTLATLVRTLAILAAMFEPVTPNKAHKLATRLGLDSVPLFPELDALEVGGRPVTVGSPLFPRVDPE
ncbi:MAG: methionine--tRNA ligase [Gemmatimonadetes bacterium]|nr:methionine--tRNA ligase [Gemmatimonadota bacterium]MYH52496.1 methionine--tRNA ligase [Gemmatimonadota bacterium]MYK65416.1 methionine--tRNA ligase [Gemmatimonadota bacterium]